MEYSKPRVAEIVEAKLRKLHEIWDEVGYDEKGKQTREELVKRYLQELLDDMISEEEGKKLSLVRSIESLLQESFQLSSEVGGDLSADDPEYDELPLLQVEKSLQRKVSEYRALKRDRLDRYAALRLQERELCLELGTRPREEFADLVPTEEQLAHFRAYLEEQAADKDELSAYFARTKAEVVRIMTELGMTPLLDFEKKVFSEDGAGLEMTRENASKLRALHEELVLKLDCTKALAAELREKLSGLWETLEEDRRVTAGFLRAHQGYSPRTIAALKRELARCQERRRHSIKACVDKIRAEMADLWDRCCFGERQRHKFVPYYLDCYTEDLLELHELEVERLKSFLERHADVFQLVEKRRELWDAMVDLEDVACDKKRLFDNRGGGLLAEERRRRVVQKELPRVEEQLLQLVERLRAENRDQSLLFYDRELPDFIEGQWREFRERKALRRAAAASHTDCRPKRKLCASASAAAETPTGAAALVPRALFGERPAGAEGAEGPAKRRRLQPQPRAARARTRSRTPRSAPAAARRRPPFRT
ncbi:protein regulator of cytokinesis 1-like [Schistocerca piceifrons]|uniref:protein regulator of cytokinesis 1-like n=1 Tax=Schistocerca piceifrons TaxID=274613 RepID=UPI001F5E77DA|nr:protein regulator of cytokinesis 1-like [Schistocerca piceifrons]